MRKLRFIIVLFAIQTIPTTKLKAQTQDNKEEAMLTYQLAQEEYNKNNYTKALQYLDKAEQLNPEAKIKASYLKAKCYANSLPETFAERDKKIKELHKVYYHSIWDKCPDQGSSYVNYVTYSDMFVNFNKKEKVENLSICDRTVSNGCFKLDFTAYSKCIESIIYYRLNGIDEEKKAELLKLKIQIENTDEYNLVKTTELCFLGYDAELKGDFVGAKSYYEKSRDYCRFKPLYFNPLLEEKRNECCLLPNFVMDYQIKLMSDKINAKGK